MAKNKDGGIKNPQIHIGEIICKRLAERGQKKKWLAEKLDYDLSSLCKMLKNSSLNTDLLFRISVAMNENFFNQYSSYFAKIQSNSPQNGN
ncbi:MAG: hypothetical protein LBR84_02145 [Tannerella sp.]|jgi:plasmid maintenance system antidote protein VapI|nr:hypothetical protein [Tannerella sp.]